LGAGAAHGITKGAEFAVYMDRESPPEISPLATLVVKETGPFTSTMHLSENSPGFMLSGEGYALRTKTGEEEDLRIYIAPDDKLRPIIKELDQSALRTGPDHRIISLVEKTKAELDVAMERDRVVFNILNPQVIQFGLKQLPFRIEPAFDDVYRVIRSAAHYNWHLRRNNASRLLQNRIQVEFKRVEELEDYDDDWNAIIGPVGENLNIDGVVDLVVDSDAMYGIKLINNTALDLYPSLFFFDNSDLSICMFFPSNIKYIDLLIMTWSIATYYQPPTSAQNLDVPLPQKKKNIPGSLSIGYGCGGSAPFSYFLRDGQDIDVGFLKLFLTTEPVDYSNIPQPSPFEPSDRGARRIKPKARLIWDTILVAVVQRRIPLAG
jgi:hypothetical protein